MVSADSAHIGQTQTAPHSGPGLMLPLVAAAAGVVAGLPIDALLAGMVAAGQGLRAICLYLGLGEAALDHHLARLGLPRPHDRPLRKAGPRGWTVADTIRLIVWRVSGIHPETIGERLKRSPNAVRAKARRLGVPRPDRKSLRRVDPETLADPLAGCAENGAVAVCGTPAGPASGTAATASAEPGETLPEKSARSAARHRNGSPAGAIARLRAAPPEIDRQPELPLGGGPRPAGRGTPIGAAPIAPIVSARGGWRPGQPVPQKPEDVCLSGDLTWIGATRKRQHNQAAVWTIGLLRFGGLDWREIAKRTGMTRGAARSFLSRAGAPIDRARKKLGGSFDEECARETERRSGFEVASNTFFTKNDREVTEYFWRRKSDRATVKRSRVRRRAVGNLDPYQSEVIEIVTRADLDAERGRTPAFAQHQAIMAEKRIDRGAWHEEPARRRDAPPVRSGFPGHAGQPLPVADLGHGRVARDFADP
jgi:hypothetical protein